MCGGVTLALGLAVADGFADMQKSNLKACQFSNWPSLIAWEKLIDELLSVNSSLRHKLRRTWDREEGVSQIPSIS